MGADGGDFNTFFKDSQKQSRTVLCGSEIRRYYRVSLLDRYLRTIRATLKIMA